MSLTLTFLSFFLLQSLVLAQDCEYLHDKRTYMCKGITETFPNKFYGNYHLNCVKCRIPSFTNRTFIHDNALISFNVSNSGIQSIAPWAFSSLGNVQYFYLQNNRIRNISEGAFYGLRQVFELHLEDNLLQTLNAGFLAELEANEVILSGNLIEEIPPNVFKGSKGIMRLDLGNNKVRILHQESFNHLDGLEYLDLQGNNLCYVPLGVFKYLGTLKQLNLARNKISRLTIGTFSGLRNVASLNLSSNGFSEFDVSSLLSFNQISTLDVSKNGMNFLDSVGLHTSAPSLRSIVIDDNLWSCATLKNLVQYFRSIHVDVMNQAERFSVPNVYGIACTEMFVKEKVNFKTFLEAAEQDAKKYVNYC